MKKLQNLLQPNEFKSNLNSVLFNNKSALLNENTLRKSDNKHDTADIKKSSIHLVDTPSRTNQNKNDENVNFKTGTTPTVRAPKKLASSSFSSTPKYHKSELTSPISPSSTSSTTSSRSSSTTTNTNVTSMSSQSPMLIKSITNPSADDNTHLKSIEQSDNLVKNSEATTVTTPVKLEKVNTDEALKNEDKIKVEEFKQDFELEEEETIKTEQRLVIDLKEDANENEPTSDTVVKATYSQDDNLDANDEAAVTKEAFSYDLNSSKSSSSNEIPFSSSLSTKPNTRDKHVCRYCGKAFPRSANLTRHLRTHTGNLN